MNACNRLKIVRSLGILLVCVIPAASASAKVKLPGIIADNMVLQRNTPINIRGWAAPNEKVTVKLGKSEAAATADAKGKWAAKLPAMKAGGPFDITVSGKNVLNLKNILIGDVWICSGQSNMQMSVSGSNNAKEEIAAAKYPNIRLFTVSRVTATTPREDCKGEWAECSPKTVPGFSAAGYFFGRDLHKSLKVPMGLIHTSWGGTIAEAWTSAEALKTMPDFKSVVEAFVKSAEAKKKGTYSFEKQMAAWWAKNDPGSAKAPGWADPAMDATAWKTMELPRNWEKVGGELAAFDGILWYRREVDVPGALAGRDLKISLGPIDDRDTTFFNGVKVGAMNGWRDLRAYKVPGKLVNAGKNVIAIRVLDTGGGGGAYGKAAQMKLAPAGGDKALSLAGQWRYKIGSPMSKLPAPPREIGRGPNQVTVLYNGMIAPLLPYGIKGAIWYQGESNASRAMQYRTLLPTMIEDWRNRFGVGKFPFFIVQLANYRRVQTRPSEGGWALLREAQLLTAQNDPKVGLAVITDIGDARNIHPKNKQDVGKRLALSALAIAYGKELVYSGPVYREMKVEGGKVRLMFDHVGGGLAAKGGQKLKGFAIAGKDKNFVWADAVIDGKTIVVSSPKVAGPLAVRYNWASNPVGNLYNKDGLPACPFRTDTQPGVTADKR